MDDIKDYDSVTLEDGEEYIILDEIDIDDDRYVYLSNENGNHKFKIRKTKMVGNIEMFVGLDSDDEFDKAMLYFIKKHKNDL